MKCGALESRWKCVIILALMASVMAWLVFPAEIEVGGQPTPPPEFADDKLAPNDLQPNDLGKKSREDYEKQHLAEKDKPWIDKYYLRGEKDVMHDTENRAKTAQKAARYQRPTRGYKNKDKSQGPSQSGDPDTGTPPGEGEEAIGGGIYKKELPKEDGAIVENVWRFVEDLLNPKEPRGRQTDDDKRTDTWKSDKFIGGKLDIGKPIPGNSFICIETAYFLASLLRELGYKVQYKNTWVSIAPNDWSGVQTAGINVWYGGQWHFYDAWRSINKEDDYLKDFHDYEMYKRTRPLERPFPTSGKRSSWAGDPEEDKGWERHKKNLGKDGARVEGQGSSRIRITDEYARRTGWSGIDTNTWDPSLPKLREIPGSGYINPTNLVAPESMEVSNWTQLGREIASLTFNNTEPLVLTYTLEVLNPTNVTVDYRIQLEIDEVDRDITIKNPATPILEGTLDPLGAINIALVFQVSPPRLTPPEPTQNVRISLSNETAHLTWNSSAGADYYTVYRLQSVEVPQNTSGAQIVGSHIASTCFEEILPATGTYFYSVTAGNEAGESQLDPDEGSVEAFQVSVFGGIAFSINNLVLLAPHIGLSSATLIATVAVAICVKRVRRKAKK